MFVCLDCGHLFEEPHRWEERHGFQHGPFEKWSGCPKCGEPFATTYKCKCCNKWITGAYIKLDSGERICDNCYIAMELGEEN